MTGLVLGPNSPIGNQSVIEISEYQTAYALGSRDQTPGAAGCAPAAPLCYAVARSGTRQQGVP